MAMADRYPKVRTNTAGRTAVRLLTLATMLTYCVGLGSCTPNSDGGDTDMHQRIQITVRDLDPDNLQQLTEVSRLVRERGLKETSEVVRMIHEGNKKEAENARAVVVEIGSLAMGPMLDNLSSGNPVEMVWDLQAIVAFQLENRARIVKWLDDMLLDKALLPPPLIPLDVEEMPPAMRLCDQAYLLTRQLFALEDEETKLINEDLYLDLTDDERDQEIARARETRKWIFLSELE